MAKINLLQIITKLELGGAQLSTLDLIKSLDSNIYNAHLITGAEGILMGEALAIPNLKVRIIPSLIREISFLRDIRALIGIYSFIKSHKIDIVHTHSSKAGILGRWAAKLAGVKFIVHTIHGWEFHSYQSKLRKTFYILLERMAAMITDQFIAVTEHDINEGLQNRIGTLHKYRLVRYGIRKEKFDTGSNGSLRKKLGLDKDDFLVGMIACFKQQKSPQDFVLAAEKVAQHVPRAKFVMVGDGQLKGRVSELVEKLSLKNKFLLLGWQRDIPQIMSSLDVLVLTSLWEGLPIVFLEAMASGKPIVANDISGNREIVKDGINGFLVSSRDTFALADRIIQLSKDRNLAQEMGERGKGALNNYFNLEHMVALTCDIYSLGLKQKGVN
jgi:glycosyltransferase involved in cell wall biosynthesis